MRLIDADALVAAYDAAHDGPPGKARSLILSAPTVDAVPVVRCKDCAFRDDPHKSTAYLPCTEMRTASNWFCADGKRRG